MSRIKDISFRKKLGGYWYNQDYWLGHFHGNKLRFLKRLNHADHNANNQYTFAGMHMHPNGYNMIEMTNNIYHPQSIGFSKTPIFKLITFILESKI